MGEALSSVSDLEQIADQLSQSADAMNEGIKAGIANGTITRERAYSMLHDEQALRSRANAIYFDAAQCVVRDLNLAQGELVKVIQDANETMKTMHDWNEFLSISADILALASGIYAARPAYIFTAFNALRTEVTS